MTIAALCLWVLHVCEHRTKEQKHPDTRTPYKQSDQLLRGRFTDPAAEEELAPAAEEELAPAELTAFLPPPLEPTFVDAVRSSQLLAKLSKASLTLPGKTMTFFVFAVT